MKNNVGFVERQRTVERIRQFIPRKPEEFRANSMAIRWP